MKAKLQPSRQNTQKCIVKIDEAIVFYSPTFSPRNAMVGNCVLRQRCSTSVISWHAETNHQDSAAHQKIKRYNFCQSDPKNRNLLDSSTPGGYCCAGHCHVFDGLREERSGPLTKRAGAARRRCGRLPLPGPCRPHLCVHVSGRCHAF